MASLNLAHRACAAGALIALLIAAPAWADPVTDLLAEVNATRVELGKAVAKKDELTAKSDVEVKTAKVLQSEHDRLQASLDAQAAVLKAQIDKQVAEAKKVVDAWDSRCSVKVVGELPPPQFAKCKGEEPYVTRVAEAANRARIDKVTAFDRKVVQPTHKTMQLQQDGVDKINASVKARFEEWSIYDAKAKALQKRLQTLAKLIGEACNEHRPEALKYCSNLRWDGQAQGLPTIESVSRAAAELCAREPRLCVVP